MEASSEEGALAALWRGCQALNPQLWQLNVRPVLLVELIQLCQYAVSLLRGWVARQWRSQSTTSAKVGIKFVGVRRDKLYTRGEIPVRLLSSLNNLDQSPSKRRHR